MTTPRTPDYLHSLVSELRKQPNEAEWIEFKTSLDTPEDIGEYISALANGAALVGKPSAYMVWGIHDKTREVVGTTFQPATAKKGGEALENWLLRLLEPKILFQFHALQVEGKPVVLLEIGCAFRHPVKFSGLEYVRFSEHKKKLKDLPEIERALWRALDRTPFETGIAMEHLGADDVLKLLDYPAYFDLLELPLPENHDGILAALSTDRFIRKDSAGAWDITNLGAALLAKKLSDFPSLARKALRVIQYKGDSRKETLREQVGARGYAGGFEGLIGYINGLLPSNEVIHQALRKTVPMYPELAIRELVANALIHQDFFVTGAGPMIEIFDDRMEITNPGQPLVDTQRFLDTPPQSRNEGLASMMRRMGICEERGSGVDKVVEETEIFQLPAPLFETSGEFTRAVLFAHRPLSKMDRADRVRACYQHACLRYVNRKPMNNTSIRERFGIESQNIALASRLIKEAVQAGVIVPYDPEAAPKLMRYIPQWARRTGT